MPRRSSSRRAGTEATFYALRLARVATGRQLVLKFEGALHGSHDYAVQSTAPRALSPYPRGVPDSDGIPAGASESVLIGEFNDLAGAQRLVARYGADLAAIIVEPLQRALRPEPGFLAGLRGTRGVVRRAADLRRDRDGLSAGVGRRARAV